MQFMKAEDNLAKDPEYFDDLDIDQISKMERDIPERVKNKKASQEQMVLDEIMKDDIVRYVFNESGLDGDEIFCSTNLDLAPITRRASHLPIDQALVKGGKKVQIQDYLMQIQIQSKAKQSEALALSKEGTNLDPDEEVVLDQRDIYSILGLINYLPTLELKLEQDYLLRRDVPEKLIKKIQRAKIRAEIKVEQEFKNPDKTFSSSRLTN